MTLNIRSFIFVISLIIVSSELMAARPITSDRSQVFFRTLVVGSGTKSIYHEFPHSKDSSCELRIDGVIGSELIECSILDPIYIYSDIERRSLFCGLPIDVKIGTVENIGNWAYQAFLSNSQFSDIYSRIYGNPMDKLMCFSSPINK